MAILLPMAIPFGIIILLNGLGLENAEYLLTGENDEKVQIEKLDDYGHPLWNQGTVIKNHNLLDQCMPQPELPYIMSFAIALQMGPNIFNAGIGTIICYSGQLNKYNNYSGMVPSVPFRLLNIEANPVAKICENIRKECEQKKNMKGCPPNDDFLKSPWHGIQFKLKDNDMNVLEIRMSTTDKIFEIPLSDLADDMLILKLTRWNSVVTLLSTKFGPGYHMGKDALKEYGSIKQELNDQLLKTFRRNAGNGSTLKNHMGPWALGVDILPSRNDEPINFFVIRSNCSEVKASFLFPTDLASVEIQSLDRIPRTVKDEETSLKEKQGIMVWGRVHDRPTNFTIHMINQFLDSTQNPFGRRILVNYEGNKSNIEFQLITSIKNNTWITPNKTEEVINNALQFRAGELFTLQLILLQTSFNLSLNCGPYIELERTWTQTGSNKFLVNVAGDVDIYKLDLIAPDDIPNTYIKTQHDVILEPGRGYFLRAKLFKIWKMKITFYEFSQEEKVSLPLVAFEAAYSDGNAHANEYEKLLEDKNQMRQVMITNATAQDIEGENDIFELHFVFVLFSKKDNLNCQANCESKERVNCREKCVSDTDECKAKCLKESPLECLKCDGYVDTMDCPDEGCEAEDSCMSYCDLDEAANCECDKNVKITCERQCKKKGRKNKIQQLLKFYLNGMQIYDYALKNGSQIDQITTVADANDTTKVEHLTWNPPIIVAVHISNVGGSGSRNLRYILSGKVPRDASAFTIDFLSSDDENLTLENSQCLSTDKEECQSFLRISTDFHKNETTTFSSFVLEEKKEKSLQKLWQGNRTQPSFFTQGEDFTIDIAWTLNNAKRVFPIAVTSAEITTKINYVMPKCPEPDNCINAPPNYVQLMGDIILFGEPEVVVAAEGKEQPSNPPHHKMLHYNGITMGNHTAAAAAGGNDTVDQQN